MLEIRNEIRKKILHLKTLFLILTAFQGILAKRIWAPLSPSIQYSILLKTISIKMV